MSKHRAIVKYGTAGILTALYALGAQRVREQRRRDSTRRRGIPESNRHLLWVTGGIVAATWLIAAL